MALRKNVFEVLISISGTKISVSRNDRSFVAQSVYRILRTVEQSTEGIQQVFFTNNLNPGWNAGPGLSWLVLDCQLLNR